MTALLCGTPGRLASCKMARLVQAPMISPELSEYIRLIVLAPLKYRRAEVVSSRFLDAMGQNSFNL
eukprot:3699782-Heterocapsa_arctica.AAC.1